MGQQCAGRRGQCLHIAEAQGQLAAGPRIVHRKTAHARHPGPTRRRGRHDGHADASGHHAQHAVEAAQADADVGAETFARRMFVYNYRIFDTYDRPVASLAVLADPDPEWRPDRFGYERLGCRHSLQFPVAKLVDHAADETALLGNPNPFALITAAHLFTRRTRRSPAARFDAKRRLVRLLYERDWTRQRILDFFSVLDWMMRLPKELEQRLWQDIEKIEGERKVKYVTSVERLAIERGLRKGMEQGLEIGIEKGIEQGRAQGTASVLLRLLNRRFGPLSPDITRRLSQSTPEQLEIWAERVLDARAIDEVFAEN